MKSFASGSFGPKLFREIALDYGLAHKSDLLSKLGIRSKHNRLLYSVSMLALACVLVLAIWATGNSMQAAEDADSSSTLQLRKVDVPVSKTSAAAGPAQTAVTESQENSVDETATADDSNDTAADSNTAASVKQAKQGTQPQEQQQPSGQVDKQQQNTAAAATPSAANTAAASVTAAANSTNSGGAATGSTDSKQPQQPPSTATATGAGPAQVTATTTAAANATAAGH